MKKNLLTAYSLLLFLLLGAFTHSARSQNCVAGTIFEDLNNNGVQDAGEPGLVGLSITAVFEDGSVQSVLTSLDGSYLFCDVLAGDVFIYPELGDPNLLVTPGTISLSYSGSGLVDGQNFAVVDPGELGSIGGIIFFDLDGNNTPDPGEPRLPGILVTLTGPALPGGLNQTTGDDGRFLFEGLPAGDGYEVTVAGDTPNTFWASPTTLQVNLQPGDLLDNLRFFRRTEDGFGNITDRVCYDYDADGQISDIETGISQVGVRLLNVQGAVVDSVSSDANGTYSFLGLPPAAYVIEVVFDPDEFTPSTPVNYIVTVQSDQNVQGGPFYLDPQRKLFSCGMAIHTFSPTDDAVIPGRVLSLRDIRDQTGAPQGVNMSWNPPDIDHPDWREAKMGSIFGVTYDSEFHVFTTSAPNIFWGSYPIAQGSGTVFWINAYTGQVTDFVIASAAATAVGGNTLFNNGSGIGNICYNGDNEVLYLTNRADQTIVAVAGLANTSFTPGTILQVFDPAFAGAGGQQLFGVGYSDGRVYYARDPAGGNPTEIYSVAVNPGDGQMTGPENLEVTVGSNRVTDIAFATTGNRMVISERGGAHSSLIYQYTGGSGSWSAAQPIYIGKIGSTYTNAAGGVDYGYTSFTGDLPPADSCETTIVGTGNALVFTGGDITYGFGIIPATGNMSGSIANLNTIAVDTDNNTSGDIYVKGTLGDVEVFDCPCEAGADCEQFELSLVPTPVQDTLDGCCFNFNYINGTGTPVYGITITALDGVEFNTGDYQLAPGFLRPNFTSSSLTIVPENFGTMPDGADALLADLCLTNVLAAPQFVEVTFLDENYEPLCTETLTFDCPVEETCLFLVSDSLECDSMGYKYTATVTNPSGAGFPVGFIKFNLLSPSPGITVSPDPGVVLPDTLFQGDTTTLMWTLITDQDFFGDSLCFIISAHDGVEERLCCAEIDTCIAFPLCDPCPFVDSDIRPLDDPQAGYCCYQLSITDTLYAFPDVLQAVQTTLLTPGVSFAGLNTLPAQLDGWSYTELTPGQDLLWTHNSGVVPDATNYPLFEFCVEGTTNTDSIYLEVNWLGADNDTLCTDTLALFCPECLGVVNDSLTCLTDADGTQSYVYTFQVENFSPFMVNAVGIIENPSSNTNISPDLINIPNIPAFPPGGVSVPISIEIDGAVGPDPEFCFDIVLRQIVGDSINFVCCYATHCIELPECESLPPFECPNPDLVSDEPCPQVFDPVCGCDGLTYANTCFALNAGVQLWTPGLCEVEPLPADPALELSAAFEPDLGGVQLNWSVANDLFDFFVLQVRRPGEPDFEVFAILSAVGGQMAYDFLHLNATAGSNEYRVIGVRNDGAPLASNITEVFIQNLQQQETLVYTYPVPATETINVTSNHTGEAHILLISPEGRVLRESRAEFNRAPVTVPVHDLGEGLYLIRLQFADGQSGQRRFVKIE